VIKILVIVVVRKQIPKRVPHPEAKKMAAMARPFFSNWTST